MTRELEITVPGLRQNFIHFLEAHCGHNDGRDSWRWFNDGCEVKEAVGLRGDGRHCVEFWLDGHSPERTEWVDGQGQKNKAFEASEWLA